MFGFQSLVVYQCAIKFLPSAYALAKHGDGELASQLRRASLSICLNIAEGTGRFGNDQRKYYTTARGSALECAAILDALRALDVSDPRIEPGTELLFGIVKMLTGLLKAPLTKPFR